MPCRARRTCRICRCQAGPCLRCPSKRPDGIFRNALIMNTVSTGSVSTLSLCRKARKGMHGEHHKTKVPPTSPPVVSATTCSGPIWMSMTSSTKTGRLGTEKVHPGGVSLASLASNIRCTGNGSSVVSAMRCYVKRNLLSRGPPSTKRSAESTSLRSMCHDRKCSQLARSTSLAANSRPLAARHDLSPAPRCPRNLWLPASDLKATFTRIMAKA